MPLQQLADASGEEALGLVLTELAEERAAPVVAVGAHQIADEGILGRGEPLVRENESPPELLEAARLRGGQRVGLLEPHGRAAQVPLQRRGNVGGDEVGAGRRRGQKRRGEAGERCAGCAQKISVLSRPRYSRVSSCSSPSSAKRASIALRPPSSSSARSLRTTSRNSASAPSRSPEDASAQPKS